MTEDALTLGTLEKALKTHEPPRDDTPKLIFRRDGDRLVTEPFGMVLTVEEGKKGPFVRVVHTAPLDLPENEAARRLGNEDIPYANLHTKHGIGLSKMNRRVNMAAASTGWGARAPAPFLDRLRSVIAERVHVCNNAFECARAELRRQNSGTKSVAKAVRSMSKRTGVVVPRKDPRAKDRHRVGVAIRLPDGTHLFVEPREAKEGSYYRDAEPGGFTVSVWALVAEDGDEDALEAILTALATLARHPKVSIEEGP